MAEAIGLVASIGQLATLAADITKLSYGYFRDVRRASRTQKNYLREVSAFIEVLLRLEGALVDAESLAPVVDGGARPSALSSDVLSEWHAALENQKVLLEKHVNSFVWPLRERELSKAIEELSRYRGILADYAAANIS